MASTLCQKRLTIFCQKAQILYGSDHTNLFIFHRGLSTYQMMCGQTLDFQCQHQQW